MENVKLTLPFVFGRIGRWWGNNPDKKRQEEIDILAIDEDNAIFGECKWRNELTGIGVLDGLIEKSEVFKQYKDKYYMLFSKSGFTKELEEAATNMGNIGLVGLKKLFEIGKKGNAGGYV